MLNPFKKKRPETSAQTDMKQEKATPSKLPFDYKPSMQELETKSSKKKYGSGADNIRVKKDPIDKLTPVTAGLAPIPKSSVPSSLGNGSKMVGPPTEKQMKDDNETAALDKLASETSSAKVNRPGTTHSIAQVQDMKKVKQHQQKLNKYGAGLEVDGMWGAKTEAASRELYPKYKTQSTIKPTNASTDMRKGDKTVVEQKSKSPFKSSQSVVDSDQMGKMYAEKGDVPETKSQKSIITQKTNNDNKSNSRLLPKTIATETVFNSNGKRDRGLLGSPENINRARNSVSNKNQFEKTKYDNPGQAEDAIFKAGKNNSNKRLELGNQRIAKNQALFDKELKRQNNATKDKDDDKKAAKFDDDLKGSKTTEEVYNYFPTDEKVSPKGQKTKVEFRKGFPKNQYYPNGRTLSPDGKMSKSNNKPTAKENAISYFKGEATRAMGRDSTRNHLADRIGFTSMDNPKTYVFKKNSKKSKK